MSAKKLELPAYDPRGMQGQGLLFATSNRGGCHMRGNMLGPEVLALPRLIDRFANQGKAGIVANHQNTSAVIDSLVLCKFTNLAVSVEFFARLLSAVSGMEFSADELMKVGERTWNMERLYNLREGFGKIDDTLPPRLLTEPVLEGPSKGHTVRLGGMLEEYYQFRGWDENGIPKDSKLKELKLNGLI
jgi:aldehyde:ferredoxin oxidoreductase